MKTDAVENWIISGIHVGTNWAVIQSDNYGADSQVSTRTYLEEGLCGRVSVESGTVIVLLPHVHQRHLQTVTTLGKTQDSNH